MTSFSGILTHRQDQRSGLQTDLTLEEFIHALGYATWSGQAEAITLIQENPNVAWRSGHKVAKTFTVSAAALKHLLVDKGNVILTSSSYPQIKHILWPEIRRMAAKVKDTFGIILDVPIDPGTGIHHKGNFILGRNSNQPERMAGFSGDNNLFIADEASGIATEILEVIEGNLAGGGKQIMTGNPTQIGGAFYDAFHAASHLWSTIHIDSRETPNITGNGPSIPGLATTEWVERQRERFGEDSPFWAVRVAGNFPAGTYGIITLQLLEAAHAAHRSARDNDTLSVGVDVAWTGDDQSVIWPVRGQRAMQPESHWGQDPTELARLVTTLVKRIERDGEPVRVNVDTIGIGAGVYSALKHDYLNEPKYTINAVSVSTVPPPSDRASTGPGYHQLRDFLWFNLKQWMVNGGGIPPGTLADGELTAATSYPTPGGKIKVTPKDDMKAILHRSTDFADALCLAVYRPAVAVPPRIRSGRPGGKRRTI